MKKRATLLIINLEKIYTMDMVNKHPLVFQHAFIAIHHERILAVGCGSWREYADKDTRILDGRGHIAVPGFIGCKPCVHTGYVSVCKPVPKKQEASLPLLYQRSR